MPRTRRYIFNTLVCLVLLLLLLLFGVGFYLVLVALYPGAVVVLYRGKWRKRRQGAYEKLKIDRDEIVGKLRKISDFAKQIDATDGGCFILHMGI